MKSVILLSLIISFQTFAKSNQMSLFSISQKEISQYASVEESRNIILLIKNAILDYNTMSPVEKMYYRSNVKKYLLRLKNKYQDYVSQNILTESISYLNELDYLEMKSPREAKRSLSLQFTLIDRL